MNKIILALFLFSTITWAVQPVSKTDRDDKKPIIRIQTQDNKEEDTKPSQIKSKTPKDSKSDHFIDIDSNNVNDQREDDLMRIKQLKTKLKELFKKEDDSEPPTLKKPNKRTK